MHKPPVDYTTGIPDERPKSKEYLETLLAGIVLTLLAVFLAIKNPQILDRFNHAVTDIQIGLLPKTKLSPLPLIVEVDERSLAAYGQWPWSRFRVARLLAAIQQAGAVAIGVDALFVEKDRTSPIEIQKTLAQDLQQKLPLTAIDNSYWDYDAILSQTLTKGPYVLSYLFSFEAVDSNSCLPKSASGAWLNSGDTSGSPDLFKATAVICNVNSIQTASNSGFINAAPDSDGIYRKAPLIIDYKGVPYPSLALQTYLTAQKFQQFVLSQDENGLSLKIGDDIIPLDKTGNLLIKFPKQGQSFKKISAHDFLSGKIPKNYLQGNIVFVGVSAAGLHEFRPTPYQPQFLGVEFHAAIADNLVRHDFFRQPDNALTIELITSAAVGISLFAGLASSGIWASIIVPCLLIVGLFIASQSLLVQTGIVLSPALPVSISLLAFLTLTLIKYAKEFLRAKALALEVGRTQEGIIGSFCSMSEYRDPETGAHILRTQEYIKALALHLQSHSQFKTILTNEIIELLFKAAPLHDIGKIGIRDDILLKNGSLNDNEFMTMKSHPQIGAEIIASVAAQIGWNPFMKIAHQISLYHQEKWDGSGYPHGLAGEDIPLPARFMALADVYDALISQRVYKPAFSHKKAVSIIKEGKNKHFDPILVDAFETIHEQFCAIALRFLDSNEQRNTLLETDDN
ncbi:adenylate cyclase [biofilm metagenome]